MDNRYYADASYYKTRFRSKRQLKLKVDELEALLEQAYDHIATETLGRSLAMNNYDDAVIDIVKRAACYEAEAIHDIYNTAVDTLDGFTIGDVNVSFNNNKGIESGGVISKRAMNLLELTPLKDRWL